MPYPRASGHQMENAKVLTKGGGAVLIEEDQLNEEKLSEEIQKLLNVSMNLDDHPVYHHDIFFPDSAQRIKRAALQLL